ncbi:MAG: PAS domain-containing sensor histidine kinase [Chitinophagaceae bacterium]|nr:PAS domain-containing sensor histidine kinase [Chitinophagaceae bacterium]
MNTDPTTPSKDTTKSSDTWVQTLLSIPEKELSDLTKLATMMCSAGSSAIAAQNGLYYNLIGWHDQRTEAGNIPANAMLDPTNGSKTFNIPDLSTKSASDDILRYLPENTSALSGVAIEDTNGHTVGYLLVFWPEKHDITEDQNIALGLLSSQVSNLLRLHYAARSNTISNALHSEEMMKIIFQKAIDAVVVTDRHCAILLMNPEAELMLGWKEGDISGMNFCDICLAGNCHDTGRIDAHAPRANCTSGKPVETIVTTRDRSTIDVELSYTSAIIDGHEYQIYHIIDISEQKKARQKLDQQRKFYENILNNIPIDLAVFDPEHVYLYVNATAIKNEELRKYIIGKDDFEYARYRGRPSDVAELRRAKFLEAKKTGKEMRWEDKVITPDGTSVTHLRRMFPIFDDSGKLLMMIGLGLDITDRKELEDKQTMLLAKLSQQNVQLSDFCNIVSHNLRAPLVNIAMLSEFIENCSDTDERKQLISSLNNVLDNLNSTFNELVESIQIQEDPEVKSEHLQIHKYLQRILESLEPEITRSGASFTTDIENAPTIHYPSTYFNSILHNLISNALKYRSPQRKPEIKISSHRKGSSIYFSVADNGLGIDMQKHKNNFFKIGKVFHHHPDAKGFGLYMIKAHIEALGGKIWVESAPDKGATFFIEFTNQNQ